MVSVLFRSSLIRGMVAALFLIAPSSALAQEVGVKAGANFASLTPAEDEDPETSRLLGAVGGVWAPRPRSQFRGRLERSRIDPRNRSFRAR